MVIDLGLFIRIMFPLLRTIKPKLYDFAFKYPNIWSCALIRMYFHAQSSPLNTLTLRAFHKMPIDENHRCISSSSLFPHILQLASWFHLAIFFLSARQPLKVHHKKILNLLGTPKSQMASSLDNLLYYFVNFHYLWYLT